MATKKAATEVIEIRPIEIKKVTIRIVGAPISLCFIIRSTPGSSEILRLRSGWWN